MIQQINHLNLGQEINDESQGTYNESSQTKFKTSMIRSNLCDYTDAYIHVKGIMKVSNTGIAAAPNNRNKKVTFKNCAPFIDCISEIKNTQVDDVFWYWCSNVYV